MAANRGRALRRHHLERIRAKRAARGVHDPVTQPRRFGVFATTPAMCSNHCCGNPRKYFQEASLQERSHAQPRLHNDTPL